MFQEQRSGFGNSPLPFIQSGLLIDDRGLLLGNDFVLVRSGKSASTDHDRARILTLLAIAYRQPVWPNTLSHLRSATTHWRQGDKALANIRLAYTGLPRLADPTTADRLRLADWLLDHGISPLDLLKALDLGPPSAKLDKHQYHPDQRRVPAGNGRESGRWVAFWHSITTWLNEPVPEYDLDTGAQVGTRTRGRAIATNPLTIGIAGATALAVGEAALAGGAAAVVGEAVLEGTTAAAVETETGIAANAARGLASEARVLREMGLARNTRAVVTQDGASVPDALTNALSVEIKDAAKVSMTKQLRIQTGAAKTSGRESMLVTGENTRVSAKTLKSFDQVIRRLDLGPR